MAGGVAVWFANSSTFVPYAFLSSGAAARDERGSPVVSVCEQTREIIVRNRVGAYPNVDEQGSSGAGEWVSTLSIPSQGIRPGARLPLPMSFPFITFFFASGGRVESSSGTSCPNALSQNLTRVGCRGTFMYTARRDHGSVSRSTKVANTCPTGRTDGDGEFFFLLPSQRKKHKPDILCVPLPSATR